MLQKNQPYSRILLKLSGELFQMAGELFSSERLRPVLLQIKELCQRQIQVAIVVGGGNIYRGRRGILTRETGDYMGMFATVINGLALCDFLEALEIPFQLQSALPNFPVIEPANSQHAIGALQEGKVVVFCGGTGRPYCSTDSAAALRAVEIHADVLLKATKVDGIYDADPFQFPQAKRFERISFSEIMQRGLSVMDLEAFCLCREQRLPILVFSMQEPHSIVDAAVGFPVGTLAYPD